MSSILYTSIIITTLLIILCASIYIPFLLCTLLSFRHRRIITLLFLLLSLTGIFSMGGIARAEIQSCSESLNSS